jgi:L-iditol 2-dehydrogenase
LIHYILTDAKEEIILPPLAPDELQIAIRRTTLCGSDLHYYNHFRNGDIQARSPLALGHESSGVVVAIGSSLSPIDWPLGTRVALEVGLPCGACPRCLEGRYNICPTLRFRASCKSFPHYWGTLQERVNHPAKWCHKLPDGVSLTCGALLEPLGVALHSTRRARSWVPGGNVLVFGAGAVGMLVAAACMVQGATKVMVADINESRLSYLLEELGWCTDTYVLSATDRPETAELQLRASKTVADNLLEKFGKSGGVDVVFECTGAESCTQTAIYAARAGGAVVLVGMGTPVMTLPISAAAHREVDILGGFRYANTYPTGIELLKSESQTMDLISGSGDDAPLEKIVTQRFYGMSGVEEAFKMAARSTDHDGALVVKVEVVFDPQDSWPELSQGRTKENGLLTANGLYWSRARSRS